MRREWTTVEISQLIELFPTQGVGRCAWRLHRSKRSIANRAAALGLRSLCQHRLWCAKELELLHATAFMTSERASRVFHSNGFLRTADAIAQMRYKRHIDVMEERHGSGEHSAADLARMLGVDIKTPRAWIDRKELRATHVGRAYTVTEAALRRFILDHPMRIDLRMVPRRAHTWLVHVIAGA